MGLEVRSNSITYNSCISACEKGQAWQQAMILLSQMPQSTIVADTITYNTTTSACAGAVQWQLALFMLKSMAPGTVSRSSVTFNAALRACERRSLWRTSLELLSALRLHKVRGDEETRRCILSTWDRSGIHSLDSRPCIGRAGSCLWPPL